GTNHRSSAATCFCLKDQVKQIRLLHNRRVEMTTHRLAQFNVPGVFDDSNYSPVRNLLEPNALADGIVVAEKEVGHHFVNDNDLRTANGVLRTEIAAADKRYVERFEIIRRDKGSIDVHLLVFAGSVAFDHDRVSIIAAGQRRIARDAGSLNS